MNKKIASLSGAALLLATSHQSALAQDAGGADIKDAAKSGDDSVIIVEGVSAVGVHYIKVKSDSAALQSLMTKAFSTHGSFDTVHPALARYEFEFTPTGDNAVAVECRRDGAPFYKVGVTDVSLADAALRAGDAVVRKITGSKDGYFAGKVVYVGGSRETNNLFLSDLFLQRATKITTKDSLYQTPSLSPDGKDVLFVSYFKTGFPDIHRQSLVTGQVSDFARFRGSNLSPSWSADGTRIAMVLSGTGNPELYVSDAQGKGIRKLATTEGGESHPEWSPDGSSIVLCSDKDGGPQIYTIAPSGGSMKRVPVNMSGNCTEPSFNPMGDGRIIFTAMVAKKFQVCVYEPGKGSRQLTTDNFDSKEPVWLSDGRHVLFTQQKGEKRSLAIVDAGTREYTPKTTKVTPISDRWACQSDFTYPTSGR